MCVHARVRTVSCIVSLKTFNTHEIEKIIYYTEDIHRSHKKRIYKLRRNKLFNPRV